MKQLKLPVLEIQYKRCPNCGHIKPWSEFSSRQTGEFLPVSYCRRCQRAYCKDHYRKNRGAHNLGRHVRARGERKAMREFLWQYLEAHPCIDCGERDIVVLEFDHVKGQKEGDISVMVGRGASRERLQREIDKCVVRCANCHRRKTAAQLNWKVATRSSAEP
jgi:hypothetical protein